jgi:hypothetical protein
MRTARDVVLVLALLGTACAREHLSSSFGRANREAFARQDVTPAKPAPPTMRLDTQEAEVIAESYVRGLSGKSKAEPEPVLYVSPQRSQQQEKLQPSVPKM